MTKNLSRWDLIDEFTAQQAACLMLGMDPNDPKASTWETEPILIRMRESYQRTAIGIVFKLREDDSNPEGVKMVGDFMELMGRRLSFFYFETERQAEDVRQADDVITRLSGWFDQEMFRRPELVRWLSLLEIESQYQFDKDAAPSVSGESTLQIQEQPKVERVSIIETRAKRLVLIAKNLGHQVPNLPQRVGRNPGPKAEILKESLTHKDLRFTPSTAKAAWDFASKEGWLRDTGLAKR